MRIRIALISDIHDSPQVRGDRHGEFGQVFLLKVVHRLNDYVQPDVVVLLGDLVDDPAAPDALGRLREMKASLDQLKMPWLAIPGNHDPEPKRFYQAIPDPGDQVQVAGVRFVRFLDPERPGWNAERLPVDLERTRRAREDGFAGPVVALQHVAPLPPGKTNSPHNYTNADAVVAACQQAAITLSVGGHWHRGTELIRQGPAAFLCVKSLANDPFTYTLVTLDGQDIGVEEQSLKLPPGSKLCDCHSHTQLAYCSKNMHHLRSPALAQLLGVHVQALTEHSGQLYFDSSTYWKGAFGAHGLAGRKGRQDRTAEYRSLAAESCRQFDLVRIGYEVDADFQGRPVLRQQERHHAQVILGAIHFLPEKLQPQPNWEKLIDQYLAVAARLCASDIDILAHPLRMFGKMEAPPRRLYESLVRMARDNQVALEINYHNQSNDPAFFRLALDAGVKLSLGSDAHKLYEIGEFTPHLRLLKELGIDGDLSAIMIANPPEKRG